MRAPLGALNGSNKGAGETIEEVNVRVFFCKHTDLEHIGFV